MEKLSVNNSDDLCMYLLNSCYVALVAGTPFGSPECVRISYAASEEDLLEAIRQNKKSIIKIKMTEQEIRKIFSSFNDKKVLLIGDAMIDAVHVGKS